MVGTLLFDAGISGMDSNLRHQTGLKWFAGFSKGAGCCKAKNYCYQYFFKRFPPIVVLSV